MTGHTIQRVKLGSLTKIGQGGQGIVYSAPGFKTKFTNAMVFKEYKADALQDMDFDALSAMPVVVEDAMSYGDAEHLLSIAAWPCAIVEQDGRPVGQVMPAIPDQFTMPLKTARGTTLVNAEIQHLLNHAKILEAREITIDDVQRYSLLREIAAEVAFLHRNGIVVGDISPKNLLFSLTPTEAAYFIDCDTMGIEGVSALPQVETPGWEAPDGEPLATIYSDSYKLGLLALRLVVGDQDVRDPKRIPTRTPDLLRKLITDALTSEPVKRPLPTAWTYILSHAIEEMQQRALDSADVEEVEEDPTPPVPVVHTRPGASAKVRAAPSPPATPVPTPPPGAAQSVVPPDLDARRRRRLIGAGIAAAAVLAVVVVIAAVTTSSGGNSYTSSRTSSPSAAGGTYDEPTANSTARSSARPTATQPTPTTRVGAGSNSAASGMRWQFQSPTGNIACDLDGTRSPATASCEVRDHFYKPEVQPNCLQNWTNRFVLTEGGGVQVECYAGAYYGAGLPQQGYGKPLTVGSITCELDYDRGVTCRDSSTGTSFQAARQEYRYG